MELGIARIKTGGLIQTQEAQLNKGEQNMIDDVASGKPLASRQKWYLPVASPCKNNLRITLL